MLFIIGSEYVCNVLNCACCYSAMPKGTKKKVCGNADVQNDDSFLYQKWLPDKSLYKCG